MGHHISAVILKGPFNLERAKAFDLHPIELSTSLTMFPISASYVDHWSGLLDITGYVSSVPPHNARVVHHMICSIAELPTFAIIVTEYFGGVGEQAAAAYCGSIEIFSPQAGRIGPINGALAVLGVERAGGSDEFDTVGLGRYRHLDEMLSQYDGDL